MVTEYKVMTSGIALKPCPFCGKAGAMRYAKGSARYSSRPQIADYKHPVGIPYERKNFRNEKVQVQRYEWTIFIAGCTDEECLGYNHKKSYDETTAAGIWNTRKGERNANRM